MGNLSCTKQRQQSVINPESERACYYTEPKTWFQSKFSKFSNRISKLKESFFDKGYAKSASLFNMEHCRPENRQWWGEEDSEITTSPLVEEFLAKMAGLNQSPGCSSWDEETLDANSELSYLSKSESIAGSDVNKECKTLKDEEEISSLVLTNFQSEKNEMEKDAISESDVCLLQDVDNSDNENHDNNHDNNKDHHRIYHNDDCDDDSEDSLSDITLESIEEDEEETEEEIKIAKKAKIAGLFSHVKHFSPKIVFGGNSSFAVKEEKELPIIEIITEDTEDFTVASIIINPTVADEQRISAKRVMDAARFIFTQLSFKTAGKWETLNFEFGDKKYQLITSQVVLPKFEAMFPHSFNEVKFFGHI